MVLVYLNKIRDFDYDMKVTDTPGILNTKY